MARKKKLNKRVVILLSLLGVALLGIVAAVIIWRLPKDPAALMAKGEAEFAAKNYAVADKYFSDALSAAVSGKANYARMPELHAKIAELQLEWIRSPVLSPTEKSAKYGRARDSYKKALRIRPTDIPCQKALTNMVWGEAYSTGHWVDYIKEADAMLALDDKDHQTYYRRGIAYAELANTTGIMHKDMALADLRKAIELKGDDPEYWNAYCRVLQRYEPDQAEAAYKQALATMPDKAVVHVAYADYLASQGAKRFDEAGAQYEEAIKAEPKNILTYLSLARFYQVAKGDLESARKKLEEAKAVDPVDHRPYRDLAFIANRRQEYDLGLKILREGIEAVVPRTTTSQAAVNDDMEQRRVESARAELYYLLVNGLLDRSEAGVPDRAKMIEEAKSYRDRLAPMGKTAIDRVDGRIAFNEGRLDEARRMLESALESVPGGFESQSAYLLIQCYLAQKMAGKAMAIADKFLKAPGFERNPIGHVFKAQCYMQYRDYEEAKKEIAAALVMQPDNATAQQMKADLDAITTGVLSPDLKITPERVPQFMERAIAIWGEDRQDEALSMMENLYDRIPDDLRVVSQLAIFYMSAKKEDKAKAILTKAQDKYKDNPAIEKALNMLLEPNAEKRMEMMLVEREAIEDPLIRALEKARVYTMFNKMPEARKCLEEAAGINPKALAVIEMQFRLALGGAEKDWDLATDCARRAAEVNITQGKVYNTRIAMVRGDFATAATLLNELLREQAGDKQLRTMLGDCYMAMNELPKAEQEYRQVADVDLSYTAAVLGMARVTELEAKWTEHATYVERAYKLAPQNPYIQQEHLKLQLEKLKPADAIRQLENWRAKYPEDGANLVRLANMYERNKELGKAEDLFKFLYERGSDKLQSARWLLGFYMRTDRTTEVETLMNQIIPASKDKVGAFILYGDVRFLQQTKDSLAQAKTAYQEAIDKDPKDPRGYLAMSNFLASRGQFVNAIESQRKYVELAPGAAGEKSLARLMLEAGQYSEAAQLLARVMETSPNDPEALELMASVLISQNKMADALKQLDVSVQANPGLVEPVLRRAAVLIAMGEAEKAGEDLKTAQRIAPTAEALRQTAGLYLRLRDEETAERVYNQAFNKQEDYRPAIMDLAQLYLSQRKWDRLDPLIAKARQLFPQVAQVYQIEAEGYKRRIMNTRRAAAMEEAYKITQERFVVSEYIGALLDANMPDKALEVCGVESARGGPWLDALKARALLQSKQVPEAEALFKKSLQEAPEDDVAFVLDQVEKAYGAKDGRTTIEGWLSVRPNDYIVVAKLADLYTRDKTDDGLKKAVALLNKAYELAAKPEQKAEIDSSLGAAYHQLKNLPKAEQHYLAALKTLPDNIGCLNNLAYMYADELNDPSKALPLAQKAFESMPKNADILDTYGWTLVKMSNWDQAEQMLLRALQSDRPVPVCRYHLGYLYEQRGDLEKAKVQYQLGLNMLGGENKEDKAYKLLQEGLDRVQEKLRSTR